MSYDFRLRDVRDGQSYLGTRERRENDYSLLLQVLNRVTFRHTALGQEAGARCSRMSFVFTYFIGTAESKL